MEYRTASPLSSGRGCPVAQARDCFPSLARPSLGLIRPWQRYGEQVLAASRLVLSALRRQQSRDCRWAAFQGLSSRWGPAWTGWRSCRTESLHALSGGSPESAGPGLDWLAGVGRLPTAGARPSRDGRRCLRGRAMLAMGGAASEAVREAASSARDQTTPRTEEEQLLREAASSDQTTPQAASSDTNKQALL